MGSYSTSEYSAAPRSVRTGYTGGADSDEPRRPRLETAAPRAAPRETDATLPTIVALGGGLSTARIVKKVPDEIKAGNLSRVIEYLLGAEVATTAEELAVKEAISQRMSRGDYRVIINNQYNLHNSQAGTNPVQTYFKRTTRQTEDGQLNLNMVDLSIVSHEEGGIVHKVLEARL